MTTNIYSKQLWFLSSRRLLDVLPSIVATFLVVLIAKELTTTTWLFTNSDFQQDTPPSGMIVNVQDRITNREIDYSMATGLFGEAIIKTVSGKDMVDMDNAPKMIEQIAGIKLMGIFHSQDANLARAILLNGEGKEAHYTVGEHIIGKVKLQEINNRSVVLSSGKEKLTLSLEPDIAPSHADTSRTALRHSPV